MSKNWLRYSILDECLYGTVSGTSFSMKAFSGGGRGSTTGIERDDLRHWSTRKKAPAKFDAEDRGGPIPLGLYLVRYYGHHSHLGTCAKLEQTIASLLQSDFTSPVGFVVTERSAFYIHGEGPKGSDGCIVPANKIDLHKILAAIKKANSPIALVVHSEGMKGDKLEASKPYQNYA